MRAGPYGTSSPTPVLTLEEVLRYSSNVGISLLAERLPKETFFAYMEALGLTRTDLLPGIRVAAPSSNPREVEPGGLRQPHLRPGLPHHPLHLAAAYGALVDGVYRTPVLLKGTEGRSWRVFSQPRPRPCGRPWPAWPCPQPTFRATASGARRAPPRWW